MEKLQGIVLENRKHSDSANIVTLYTRSRGRISFISTTGSGKGARLKAARLMPLALVETEVRFSENKELQRLGTVSSPHSWQDLYFHPVKRTLAIFLTEFLNRVFRYSSGDPYAWDYLHHSIRFLDETDNSIANFHIAFLVGLLPFAGIRPDTASWQPGDWFSMDSAEFSPLPTGRNQWISPEEAASIPILGRITFENMTKFRFSGEQRRRVLSGLLRYYASHYPGADSLNCIDVLRELFE
ncbi:MAG: hypothetical protein HDS82_02000 [Bacteroidales bacterium]|nr:hypothetical protein [Bacteroidales bacterium]